MKLNCITIAILLICSMVYGIHKAYSCGNCSAIDICDHCTYVRDGYSCPPEPCTNDCAGLVGNNFGVPFEQANDYNYWGEIWESQPWNWGGRAYDAPYEYTNIVVQDANPPHVAKVHYNTPTGGFPDPYWDVWECASCCDCFYHQNVQGEYDDWIKIYQFDPYPYPF